MAMELGEARAIAKQMRNHFRAFARISDFLDFAAQQESRVAEIQRAIVEVEAAHTEARAELAKTRADLAKEQENYDHMVAQIGEDKQREAESYRDYVEGQRKERAVLEEELRKLRKRYADEAAEVESKISALNNKREEAEKALEDLRALI